jgi:UDP-glucose 4-epimerase
MRNNAGRWLLSEMWFRETAMRKLKDKSVLVTGAAGFIGSHLCDRLVDEEPRAVIAVDNLYLGKEENLVDARNRLRDRFHFHFADAGDEKVMRDILQKHQVEVVYDLAVVPLPASLERPMWSVMENTRLTAVLCELQRERLFESLVHFSSSETYGTAISVPITEEHPYVPSTPYAAGKLAGDQTALSYHHTFGLDISCLRPFNNYGPRQNALSFAGIIPIVIGNVMRGEPVTIYGDGHQTRDFIFVRDTAQAAVRLYEEAEAAGQVVNIGSGAELSINALVASILDILGQPKHPIVHGPGRPGDVRRHLAGTHRAETLLKFSPTTDFSDGIAETVAWYAEQFPALPEVS